MSESTSPRSTRCHLVGEGTLLIQCAQVLLENGFVVGGIASDEDAIVRWCVEHAVPRISRRDDLATFLKDGECDYLFSVVNLRMLDPSLLSIPKKGAINFHDGPLPDFAGVNTPMWALLDDAKTYGVTWHEIEAEADTGRILAQERFDIADDETQFSLNAKCFTAGIESFSKLVELLLESEKSGTKVQGREQDLTSRRYCDFFDRPAAASVLDWTQAADKIERVVRAHDTGAYPNPVAWPKVVVAGVATSPQTARVLQGQDSKSSETGPGVIVHTESDQVQVTTGSDDLGLSGFRDFGGRTLGASDLEAVGLVVGATFDTLDSEGSARLTAAATASARGEGRTRGRLIAPLLTLNLERANPALGKAQLRDVEVSPEVASFFGEATSTAAADRAAGALAVFFARAASGEHHLVGVSSASLREQTKDMTGLFVSSLPWKISVNLDAAVSDALDSSARQLATTYDLGPQARDLLGRTPRLQGLPNDAGAPVYAVAIERVTKFDDLPASNVSEVAFFVDDKAGIRVAFDAGRIDEDRLGATLRQLGAFLQSSAAGPKESVRKVSLLSESERRQVLEEWNDTTVVVDGPATVHGLFERQADLTPNASAVVAGAQQLTYAELEARANRMASHLATIGVTRGTLVGVSMTRTVDMMVALLGVMKAGGAYVPLDPAYPRERIEYMIEDARIPVILCDESSRSRTRARGAKLVCVDGEDAAKIASHSPTRRDVGTSGDDLAYVIYTSGSTGRPKGVMIEHRNVANFFVGMDDRIGFSDGDTPGTWLAVTSLNFDISVLELFWTLARGFCVVLFHDEDRAGPSVPLVNADKPIDFGAFYFSSDEGERSTNKYRLLIEGAKFADTHGFNAVWTPERHFHAFGGLFPNPSVTSAAIATITENVSLRAGSCVSPLHSSIRIAEEWSVVDNLSAGRAGVSFAAGWQPNDFAIREGTFADRKNIMFQQIEEVRKLWRGDSVAVKNGNDEDIEVRILPRPVQEELPIWVTAAGNPETFAGAGRAGTHILTHLLGQTLEELREKIGVYRTAWREAGHPGEGIVSLMLHTFVAETDDEAKEIAREPMKEYLRSAVGLIKEAAWSFPTFKDSTTTAEGGFSTDGLSPTDFDALLDHAYERYFEASGLFGSMSRALKFVDDVKGTGADEIACLIDFGVSTETVLAMLPQLAEVLRLSNRRAIDDSAGVEDVSLPALVEQYNVSHLQCTPSMASMLAATDDTRAALAGLKKMLVGGEAFPLQLAKDLSTLVGGDVVNMYGPTETTIWSTTQAIVDVGDQVPIGRPIANTDVYVLDESQEPVPPGALGELVIGGAGVVRGYLGRADLTAERFLPDPFRGMGARMYRTGDLVRFGDDGVLEFQGRLDHQVKIRGYRMELGEIETQLAEHEAIRAAVVLAREDSPGDKRLCAYVIRQDGAEVEDAELKTHLRACLPDFMVPTQFVSMQAFPKTPNQKIDRNAFPVPESKSVDAADNVAHAAPDDEMQKVVAEIWQRALAIDGVGIDDNFFDLGGHSLLTIRVLGMLKEAVDVPLGLVDLFRYPTIRSLCAFMAKRDEGPDPALQQSAARGDARKEALARRKKMAARRRRPS